jgi:hypothetical protein
MATKGLDHWSDITVVVVYFVLVMIVGLWVSYLSIANIYLGLFRKLTPLHTEAQKCIGRVPTVSERMVVA